MMGIRSKWRNMGLGRRLKEMQAEKALENGYRLIAWTYDPLETANGYLNIGKLGAICSSYVENYYGDMPDQLNRGLPSDRFQVEWWIDNLNKPSLPSGSGTGLVNWQLNDDGFPQPQGLAGSIQGAKKICVAVPAHFQSIKKIDLELAKKWREITRKAFTSCFTAGWVVAGFHLHRDKQVHEYVLVKRKALSLPPAPWQKGE